MGSSIKKITKILTAIDFSSHSKSTLGYAYEISQITEAKLVAINIINPREINVSKEMADPKTVNEILIGNEISHRELKFKGLLVACGFKNSIPIKFMVDYGIPLEKILETINREEADLLVIGSKGQTNRQRFFFGSVAEKLFRHCPIPVISLRSIRR